MIRPNIEAEVAQFWFAKGVNSMKRYEEAKAYIVSHNNVVHYKGKDIKVFGKKLLSYLFNKISS